jgi:hypothetical protein
MAVGAAAWMVPWALLAGSGTLQSAHAADACEGFSWDVHQERSVFATTAQALPAGRAPAAAPGLLPNHLYELSLSPQDQVSFAVPPGKRTLADGAFAGLAHVHIAQPGSYRVALNEGFWIDLISADKPLTSSDFTGQPHCNAPRKIVQFVLPAGDLVLQVSGAASASVRVAIVPAPAAPSPTAPTH